MIDDDLPFGAPMPWRLVGLYLVAIVAANLLVATFGPSVTIVNAFVFIGLDLTTRDRLDEAWHGRPWPMLALILVGGLLSWLLNRDAGIIAIASTVAFIAASTADWLVYHLLGDRSRRLRVNGSNVVSAAVDSLVFPTIAFGTLLPVIVIGQFIAKVAGGAVWYEVLRALSDRRHAAKSRRWHRWDCPEIWGYGCSCGGAGAPK